MIQSCRIAGRAIVFVPALFAEDDFQRALESARRRGCRIEYAAALAHVREIYAGLTTVPGNN